MDDVERIAAGLTKAQRTALLWLPEYGAPRVHEKGDPREVSFWAMAKVFRGDPAKEVASVYSLCVRGDGERRPGRIWPDTTWAITPLGFRVAQHLKQENAK